MCVPTFQKAIEQSRIDIAAANLRAIWAAERLYWLENHVYTDNMTKNDPLQSDSLIDLGLLDPEIISNSGGFDYSVNITTSTSNPKTLATAIRQSEADTSSITLTINETGEITSTGTAPGFPSGTTQTPGFQ